MVATVSRVRSRCSASCRKLYSACWASLQSGTNKMAVWVKRGKGAAEKADANRKVRETVEGILADIEKRGDDAVRDLSRKFDGWDRPDFRLSRAEIAACKNQLSSQDLDDIAFAQAQVRGFA